MEIVGNEWIIISSNEFSRDWLIERYLPDIQDAIAQLTNETPDIEIITEEQLSNTPHTENNIFKILKQI